VRCGDFVLTKSHCIFSISAEQCDRNKVDPSEVSFIFAIAVMLESNNWKNTVRQGLKPR